VARLPEAVALRVLYGGAVVVALLFVVVEVTAFMARP
jgi:hypothetical protein